ncbi:Serine/threonine protein kinase [Micromonospora citrea]|uniref:non-specific serine/threonine protein kinase n=1 Tax=Micromonospora citrea TaxID=47855 RepID=A0A1C6VRV1_9ACTN|nr:Serine/threonine protein kinase [Micromonospora citrea]
MLSERYRLDERVGTGGMGAVWRCTDLMLERVVAVKVLLPALSADPEFTARFRAEARMLAALRHPGVVAVHDVGLATLADGGPLHYLVMEYVDGRPLSAWLRRAGRLDPASTMSVVAQAADALHAAHLAGIVHRDVKPGNLMVKSDGRVVLMDFGIARSGTTAGITAANVMLGTASYMSPEQAANQPISPAVDVYALGAVAYFCLAGQPPFDGDNPLQVALRHVHEAPPPLPPGTPPAVVALVEQAMAKRPGDRFPDAAAMADAAAGAREATLAVIPDSARPPWAIAGPGPAAQAGPVGGGTGAADVATPRTDPGGAPAAPSGVTGPLAPPDPWAPLPPVTPVSRPPAHDGARPAVGGHQSYPAGVPFAATGPPADASFAAAGTPTPPTDMSTPPAGTPYPPTGSPVRPAGPVFPAPGAPFPPAGVPPVPGAAPLPPAGGPFGHLEPDTGSGAWGSTPPTREDPIGSGRVPRRRASLLGAAATVFVVLAGVVGATAVFSGDGPDGGDVPAALTGGSTEQSAAPAGDEGTGEFRNQTSSAATRSAAPSASPSGPAPTPGGGGEPSASSSGRPVSSPTTSQPSKPNPYTPVQACGSGYKVIDSAPLTVSGVRKGKVYLLYHAGTGTNCVVTMKESAVGTATSASAWLEVQGRARSTDSGSFAYYAGPVRAKAARVCVKWGGSAGGASYGSGFEHCG